MEIDSTYVHSLEGRLRIKVAGVKGSPPGASRVEARLRSLEGVHEVVANPMTGSVLVLYDAAVTGQRRIVAELHALGCLPYRAPTTALPASGPVLGRIARVLAHAATEAALQRALLALI
jgi:copper chaperone CopZ